MDTNFNPFETEPTENDLALVNVMLLDDNGNLVGFDNPAYEDPTFDETEVEFVDEDCDPCPDEMYDHLANFASGTYIFGSWIGSSGTY